MRSIFFLLVFSISAIASDIEPLTNRIDDMIFDNSELLSEPRFGNSFTEPKALGARFLFTGTLWSDGVVPMAFAPEVTEAEKEFVLKACEEWTKAANVRCKSHEGELRYMTVQKSDKGCYSHVGMGPLVAPWAWHRTINLGPNCWYKHVVLHELGHTLGMIHEHQRDDRDEFIDILWDSMLSSHHTNFSRIFWTTNYSSYDFDSIMHYNEFAFSRFTGRLRTIQAKKGYENYQPTMGRNEFLSAQDKQTMASLYGAPLPASSRPRTP